MRCMKKIVLILLLSLLPLAAPAQRTKALPRQKVTTLVSDFSGEYGFEVVRVGRLGLGVVKAAMRKAIRASGDDEAAAAFKIISGVKSVSIVEYGDARPQIKERFERRLHRMLDDVDLLMEAKDDGTNMRVFGVVDEDGGEVRDFMAFSPNDCVLICLYGSMSMRELARLMKD